MSCFQFPQNNPKMSEKFCLKWNDFQSNVSNSFSLLRNEDYLHDVTIVTDDNEQTAAHKLVLSASSEYFKNIFKKNKHPHPLLCLEGVNSGDIRNVMDYIYNGELQIFQEDLDGFLNVAQRLKIEGLLAGPEDDQEEEVNIKKTESYEDTFHQVEDSPIQKTPSQSFRPERSVAKLRTEINQDNMSELEEQIEQHIIRNTDRTFSCKVCGKNSATSQHIKWHVETHLDGLSFNCPVCEKTFRSRNSLHFHKSTFHRGTNR